jgi:hypothetical protein
MNKLQVFNGVFFLKHSQIPLLFIQTIIIVSSLVLHDLIIFWNCQKLFKMFTCHAKIYKKNLEHTNFIIRSVNVIWLNLYSFNAKHDGENTGTSRYSTFLLHEL